MATRQIIGWRRNWRSELVELEKERDDARNMVRILYRYLVEDCEVDDMAQIHDIFAHEKLPPWLA